MQDAPPIDRVNQWLAGLAPPGVVAFVLDADGAIAIDLDDGGLLVLEVDAEAGLLRLHIDLTRVDGSHDGRALMLERAMQLNLHKIATGGATIGLDADRDMLVLAIMRSVEELDAERLIMPLEAFTRVAPELRAALRQSEEVPESAGAALSAGFISMRA
jgi:hypothetical protein